jgi:hypothetical protein
MIVNIQFTLNPFATNWTKSRNNTKHIARISQEKPVRKTLDKRYPRRINVQQILKPQFINTPTPTHKLTSFFNQTTTPIKHISTKTYKRFAPTPNPNHQTKKETVYQRIYLRSIGKQGYQNPQAPKAY